MENRIKVLRQERKLSQKRLAELVGTSQQQIQRIETNYQSVRFDLALRICEALEVPIQTVFPGTKQAVSIARAKGKSLREMWGDQNLRQEMEKVGMDMDPHTWFFRYRLCGGAEGVLPVSGWERGLLWRALHREDPDHYFVVFDSEETQVVLNLNHLSYGHIVWEVPAFMSEKEGNGDWDVLGFGLQGHSIAVYMADSAEPLYFSVIPDEPLEGDRSEDEGQFRLLVRLAETALPEETDEVISFWGDESDTVFLRASDVAMIKIPMSVLYPETWEDEEEANENGERPVTSKDQKNS